MPGGEVIQAGSDRQHHFDKFWALAMAGSLIAQRVSRYERDGVRSLTLGDHEPRERLTTWTLRTGPHRR